MLIYATPADLAEWSGRPAPDNAAALLRIASMLVTRKTRSAVYDVQPSGLPKEPDVTAAFRDAVTAQAAYWAVNGIDPERGILGETGQGHVIGKSIGGASLNYSAELVKANWGARGEAVQELSHEAFLILDEANLVNQQPWSYS